MSLRCNGYISFSIIESACAVANFSCCGCGKMFLVVYYILYSDYYLLKCNFYKFICIDTSRRTWRIAIKK